MGTFSDLASPYLSGHSAGVSTLAGRVARACGFARAGVSEVRRAALVHDVGRVGVDPGIRGKTKPPSVDDREQIRLHSYHTERVLDRAPFLARLGEVASYHHERVTAVDIIAVWPLRVSRLPPVSSPPPMPFMP